MQWSLVQLVDAESCADVSDSSSAEDVTYNTAVTKFVGCPGWGIYLCDHSVIIPEGGDKMCNNCKRKKRDAMEEVWVVELAIQDLLLSNQATRGPPPEAEADAEADDDNVTFRVDHELFTAKEAVVAAIEVATALAFNNEIGFEKLINTEHEPDDVSKNRCRHWPRGCCEEAILRLAYIADPTVIPQRLTKAASALGGVSTLRGLIPGKDGMPNVGHVEEAAQRRFIDRMWNEILQKRQRCMFSDRERDQCREFLKCDDKAIAAICDAALAAACVAYIIEKNVCQLDAEHLKCKMFRGGCWASGNLPTWE